MTEPAAPQRGAAVLRRALASGPHHVARLDSAGFARWLEDRLARHRQDPVFAQRLQIRDLQQTHLTSLNEAANRVDHAHEAYSACGCAPALEQHARALHSLERAVEGLTSAVAEERADPAKLEDTRRTADDVRSRLDARRRACAEWVQLDEARQAQATTARRVGLTEAREHLDALNRARGRRGSSRGSRYEEMSEALLRRWVIPDLSAALGAPVHCVTGATLRCARGEFDHLLFVDEGPDAPVRVVAVIESKRNIDDLGHGFRQRQENLAWLLDDEDGFDLAAYRSRVFPTGRFDRPIIEVTPLGPRAFAPTSFADLDRLRDLWFVTEDRPLTGLSSRELQTLMHRVATMPEADPDAPGSVERLREWLIRVASPLQAADVLQRYLDADLADHLLLTPPRTPAEPRR